MCLENKRLKHEINLLQHKFNKANRNTSALKCSSLKTDRDISFFTGLPNKSLFEDLHDYIAPFVNRRWRGFVNSLKRKRTFFKTPKKFGPQRKLCSKDEFLLALMKLRLGLLYGDLAFRFQISTGLVSQIFHAWLTSMYKVLGHLVWFAPQEHIQASKPKRYNCYPNLRSIVDASEIFIETPKDPKLQSSTYSTYKHHNTAKFLVSCAPNSTITFVSKAYGGRASDKQVTISSGYLDLHDPYDTIMADKGFNISDECAARRLILQVPPGLRGQSQMSVSAVKKTKKVANLRILIEQVIRRMKTFRILAGEVPITLVPHLHKIIKVCAALTNIKHPMYKQ